jgi:chromosome partitioning protein
MIITVASNMQGVGKTLIATNIAALRLLAGHRVRLIDIAPQQSSAKWCAARNASEVVPSIPAVSVKGKSFKGEFDEISAGYNDVIIDTDWRNSAGNLAALEVSDQVVVPLLLGPRSVEDLKPMIRRIKTARRVNPGLRALMVIVRASDTLSVFHLDTIRRYVAKVPFAALHGTIIHERDSLQIAGSAHLSIFEYKPADARAIAEMHDLYRAQKRRRTVQPSLSRLLRDART